MSGWALMVVALAVGTVIGKTAHEAIHALTALFLGAKNVRIDWIDSAVYYHMNGSIWAHRTIGFAPLFVGVIVLLPGYLATHGRFSWDVLDLGFAAFWFWFTFSSVHDFKFDRERANGMVVGAD